MYMTKRDILELRRRFQKKGCTFDKLCGCYVNGTGQILLKFQETFSDLEEDEYYKYLEIAKKVLSGTLGNNLLELEFAPAPQPEESHQAFLLALNSSKLENEDLLDRLYEQIIQNHPCEGNFLILIFHDIYDVMVKTSDRGKLDESQEVYEYLLCAVCPVELSKAGLGYREEENRIGCRVRDWVVSPPSLGFVYPAFCERSRDVNRITYYVKNPKEPQPGFMEEVLGCTSQRTAAEEKLAFQTIVEDAFAGQEREQENAFLRLQKNLSEIVGEEEEGFEQPPIPLTAQAVDQILEDAEIPEENRTYMQRALADRFGETPAVVQNLIDSKAVEENARREQTIRLEKQISTLREQLAEQGTPAEGAPIQMQLPPEKAEEIRLELAGGQRYLMIPLEEEETVFINGVDTKL